MGNPTRIKFELFVRTIFAHILNELKMSFGFSVMLRTRAKKKKKKTIVITTGVMLLINYEKEKWKYAVYFAQSIVAGQLCFNSIR